MKKICNIFNYPSHYRAKIYKLLDSEYDCKFVFSDEKINIKKMNLDELKNVRVNHVSQMGHFLWLKGLVPLAFKRFDSYIMTVATNDLSHWLFLIILKMFSRKKVYVWCHGFYGKENNAQLMVRKMYYGLVDGLFLYGDYARNLLINHGVKPEKMFVVHNSLNYDKQLEIRKTIKSSNIYKQHFVNEHPVLVMIGRLNNRKKLDLLFEAMAILNKEGSYFNAVIIGDGDYKYSLEKRVQELDLKEQVWFYGACYDEYLNAELLYNADLCVIPGDVGLSAIHSLMFGVPVITHNYFPDQGPEFEVIHMEQTGAFYKAGDIISLSDTIKNWFSSHSDDREQVRNCCYNVIDTEWNPYYQMKVFKKVLGQ